MQSKQTIGILERYEILFLLQGGLSYLDSYKLTEQGLEIYPAIFITAYISWNPMVLKAT